MSEPADLCRLCTKATKDAVNLFVRSRKRMLQRIEDVTGIMLEDIQDVPQQICQQCEKDLEQAYSFRERCIEAQMYFNSSAYKRKLRGEQTDEHSKRGTRYSKRVQRSPPSPVAVLKEEPMDIFESEPEMDAELLLLDCEPDVVPLGAGSHSSGRESTNESDVSWRQDEKPLRKKAPIKVKIDIKECVESELKDLKQEQLEQKTPKTEIKQEQKDKPKRSKTEKQTEFICDQCGRHFKNCSQFNVHLRKHSGIKPYQCEICAETFYTQSDLTAHMNKHTGKQPIPCRYCPRRFTEYSSRVRHERTHTNERPFLCTQCGKAFTQSYILKNHMLVHTGERSFKCHYCDKTFSRQTHLTTHYRALFHKQNVEKYEQLNRSQMKEETAQEQLAPSI